MKRLILSVLIAIALTINFKSAIAQGGAGLDLSWPVNNSVIQRGTGDGAFVTIAGQLLIVSGVALPSSLSFTVKSSSASGVPGPVVQSGTLSLGSIGQFYNQISLSKGWYYLQIEGTLPGRTSPTSFWAGYFGVGDVFVIAGQSNAKGIGLGSWSVPATSSLPMWIVSINEDQVCRMGYPSNYNFTFNKINEYSRISPTGDNSWCYATLGKLISDANGGMPVAFFNTAYGGSGIKNWYESSTGGATNDLYSGAQYCSDYTSISTTPSYFQGQPFTTLKNALQMYGGMFGTRAVLWHQGEAETDRTTAQGGIKDTPTYQAYLDSLINRTRRVFNDNLSWMISKTTYVAGATTPNVITAQGNIAAGTNRFLGPYTDLRGASYRATDNLHFRENSTTSPNNGLTTLANDWKAQIDNSGVTAFYRITALTPPTISVTKSGANRILTVQAGATEYRWGTDVNSATSTGTTNTMTYTNPSNTTVRCFVRYGKNWTASARITMGTGSCTSCKEGVENLTSAEDFNIGFQTYPNPLEKEVTIKFNVLQDDMVRLELIDNQGRVLKVIAHGYHAKGNFEYPMVKIDENATTVSYCRLTIGQTAYTKKLIVVHGK